MQAVVKTPRIEVNIKGEIPSKLISLLEEEFGENLQIAEEGDEEEVSIFGTDWFQEVKAQTTPADNLKIYRENHSLTQAKLGELLGGIPRQHISNMERGIRPISIKNARKLAEIFGISPAKFI